MLSTAEDMAHSLIAQTNGEKYQDQQLISPAGVDLMYTPPAGVNSTYAMGWTESKINDRRKLEHNGVLSTYSADAILLPEENIGIALLYNVSSFPTNTFAEPEIQNGLIVLFSGIDLPLVQVLNGTLVSIAAWYDNEYGYATRLAKMAEYMAKAALPQRSKTQKEPAD